MPARPLRGVLLAALLLAPCAGPAHAAVYDIAIGPGNQYLPATLSVTPGDTVRWAASGTHPLRFDGEQVEYTTQTARTLDTPGTVAFYCRVHGGPGGDGMSGVVTVTAAPNAAPAVALARETPAPVAGLPVTFRVTASDPEGQPLRIDWDLDGDGAYERLDGGATVSASFAAGAHVVSARAVDPQGASAAASLSFTVAPAPGGGGPGGGEPGGTGPGGDDAAPVLRAVTVARTVTLRTLRRRGVRLRVTPSEDGTVAATLRDRRGRRIGRATATAHAGEPLSLRVRARRARPGRLRLRVVVTDAAGNRAAIIRTIRARR